jgi:hypothetical protein
MRDFSLSQCHYHWNFDDAELVFPSDIAEIVTDICVIGSVSAAMGTFLWAWANATVPIHARRGLEKVREFGCINGLEALTKPEWPGARPEGLEMAAVAGRVLDAAGIWIAPQADVTLFFALSNFRRRPASDRPNKRC